MPCSPESVPPRATAASKISRAPTRTRAISSGRAGRTECWGGDCRRRRGRRAESAARCARRFRAPRAPWARSRCAAPKRPHPICAAAAARAPARWRAARPKACRSRLASRRSARETRRNVARSTIALCSHSTSDSSSPSTAKSNSASASSGKPLGAWSSTQRMVNASINSIEVGPSPGGDDRGDRACGVFELAERGRGGARERGFGSRRSVISVIVPRVPSAPVKSRRRS